MSSKTTEQFKQDVFNLVGDEYTVMANYINAKTKILMKHNLCGNEYEVKPNNFLSGKRCNKCNGGIAYSHDDFVKLLYDKVKNEYIIIDTYKNAQTKVTMRHEICGYEWKTKPNSFISGARCPKCAGNARKNTEIYNEEVFNLVGNEYEVIGEYINYNTKIKMLHKTCNRYFYMRPHDFINGNRCSNCRESKGECIISKWLINNNIKYVKQFKFDDCKDKRSLPFDFGIMNDNDELRLLIEYDGMQHFKPMKFYKDRDKNIEKYNYIKKHDEIKNKYCKENNIKLIRIPYHKIDDIPYILEKEILFTKEIIIYA